MRTRVPQPVKDAAAILSHAGFEVFLVGGCVRDLLLGREPKDWDLTTNATPEEIQRVFPETVYENTFGTVGVKTGSDEESLKIVEITTYRLEGEYSDFRHPDKVVFSRNVEDDLARRDFTINAIAMDVLSDTERIVDPFDGRGDLRRGVVRAVGDPSERFREDALRLLRAVRFATEFNFSIEDKTRRAMHEEASLLSHIAAERIRDEMAKLLLARRAAEGIRLLEDVGQLQYIMPELREGIEVGQNKHHIYSVFEHNVRALEYAASKDYSLVVRVASLLHDVGKPRVKRGNGPDSTFYNHDIVGGKMTHDMLDRLHFSREIVTRAAHLVRHHLFYYNVGEVTEAGVRRFLQRVGIEHLDDLLKVREADRIGSGVPKATPYKTRHLLFMIEKVRHDPLSPKMLAIKGGDVMRIAGVTPGPKVGHILAVLLEEVIDDPSRNTPDYLQERVKILAHEDEAALGAMASRAKEKKEDATEQQEKAMKDKYFVK